MSCEFLHRTPDTSRTWVANPLVSRRTIRCPTVAVSCQLPLLTSPRVGEGSLFRKHPQHNGHFLAIPFDLGWLGKQGTAPCYSSVVANQFSHLGRLPAHFWRYLYEWCGRWDLNPRPLPVLF